MALRQVMLMALLAATLAAVWWVSGEEGADMAVVEPVRSGTPGARPPEPGQPGATAATAAESTPEAGSRRPRERFIALGPDLFPPQSWRPPPQPVVLLPPPPPQAPPVPFRYLGRWAEDGRETLFLAEGDRTHAVDPGSRLGAWRVEAIDGETMTLRYLPLDQTRTLRLAP